jgi:outer membrane receptor protein involved in Fe transport
MTGTNLSRGKGRLKDHAFRKRCAASAPVRSRHRFGAGDFRCDRRASMAQDAEAEDQAAEVAEPKRKATSSSPASALAESAQNLKRNADTFVDVITAEDIGALPDRSVAEALQRVPGVNIGRFEKPSDPDRFSVEGTGRDRARPALRAFGTERPRHFLGHRRHVR